MILAAGFVPVAQGKVFTAKANTRVDQCRFFNKNAASQTMLVYFKQQNLETGEYVRYVLLQNWSADPAHKRPIFLGAGDTIEASTTTADAVRFNIIGETQS